MIKFGNYSKLNNNTDMAYRNTVSVICVDVITTECADFYVHMFIFQDPCVKHCCTIIALSNYKGSVIYQGYFAP